MAFHTDHQGILDGIAKGRKWCCAGSRPHADVWQMIWFKLDDFGFDDDECMVKVIKVKAHTSRTAQQQMTAELFLVKGNEEADLYAKLGSTLDANFGKSEALSQYADKVKWAMSSIAAMHVALGQNGWQDVEQIQHGPKPLKAKPWSLQVGPAKVHVLVAKNRSNGQGQQWQCARCGRCALTKAGKQQLKNTECLGAVVQLQSTATANSSGSFGLAGGSFQRNGRALAREGFMSNGHSLFKTGCIVFCKQCGKYSSRNLVGLKAACNGPPHNVKGESTQLRRMKAGLHPCSKEWLGPVTKLVAEGLPQ